ncbi:site-specific integrase [Aliiroseovarius sp. CAU 1755]
MFYFRKRLPTGPSNSAPNQFICLSLRTHLPLDAVKRAARLLSVYEKMEIEFVDALTKKILSPETTKAVLMEAMRSALSKMVDEESQAAPLSDADIDQRVAALEAENRRLRRAARNKQWGDVQTLLQKASALISVELPEPLPNDLGQRANTLERRLNDVKIAMDEGDDVRTASRDLLTDHAVKDFDAFVQVPVLLAQAKAKTDELYPSKDMKRITAGVHRLLEEFLGDVPIATLTKEKQKEFLGWASRLPRTQGRKHGRNRYGQAGKTVTKAEEISKADAKDLLVMEEMRSIEGVSDAEKRAKLADRLVPRVTISTLKKYRDAMNRMVKSAKELGANTHDVISYREMELHIKSLAPDDKLYVRVTKPKIRMPWTKERISMLLTSPIYSGCASKHRRWQRGKLIIRDADYWVPLIVLTIGSRIEEILLLKRSDVRFRDGHYLLAIASGADNIGKTEDSKRLVPIPQMLIDLGFVDWFQSLKDEHGVLLFPEAAGRSQSGDVSSAYGKHLRRIFDHIGIGDFDEDFYALRKTFSSMLNREKVDDGERQAIAGHRHGSIINVHYTAHHIGDLKEAVDKADFKLKIGRKRQYGFPVILSCDLAQASTLDVEITLGDDSEADAVTVRDPRLAEPLFDSSKIGKLSGDALKSLAAKLREVTDLRPLKLPKNALKRAAFEHLQALA